MFEARVWLILRTFLGAYAVSHSLGSPIGMADDYVADLQATAMREQQSPFGHWGTQPQKYSDWKTHSNRLIPVYTYGAAKPGSKLDLRQYTGRHSGYRDVDFVRRLYGRIPAGTVNEKATWGDQTDVATLQRVAAAAGRKYIFLVIFDGMDWETSRAAAIYNQQEVSYQAGRGSGTHFQEYQAGGTSQFGYVVTSPHNSGTEVNVDAQTVDNPGGKISGGYSAEAGGNKPWSKPDDPGYLIQKPAENNPVHAYTDSAASATSLACGIKTYYNAVGVDHTGNMVPSVAHELQADGWAVGVVTSVPISHATPAAMYAHNVTRKDYQDISRDMLGLPSVSHPQQPLPGMDVVLGTGFGDEADEDKLQGENFVPGNIYLTNDDLKKVSVERGGKYITAVRTAGQSGTKVLQDAATKAATENGRLLGFFGISGYESHLPWQTANGDYVPVADAETEAQKYSPEDLNENPTLAEMTQAALKVLSNRGKKFWLMVEPGDVDWANHDNNIDNAIGAVNSGDEAVKVITDWVEANSSWDESLMIVTADHGHLFTFVDPAALIAPRNNDD